jgi:hypothetical protein
MFLAFLVIFCGDAYKKSHCVLAMASGHRFSEQVDS